MAATQRGAWGSGLEITEIRDKAVAFDQEIKRIKHDLVAREFFWYPSQESFWYPYSTLSVFLFGETLFTGERRSLLDLIGTGPVADIGGGDGDLAFFMESLGCTVDFIDYDVTNNNGMRGVQLLKHALSSNVTLHNIDLDAHFTLPRPSYNLAFFLGTLYHLKNPYYILETLAKATRYCVLSTRIARQSPDHSVDVSGIPVAYLLDEREANNDPTNYWIFSDAGLRRILWRSGWTICEYFTGGNTTNSDPVSAEGDERAFCLIRSRLFA